MTNPNVIFQPDEMKICKVNPRWTPEQLLSQQGLFLLGDIYGPLGIKPSFLSKKLRELRKENQDTYQIAGIRILWRRSLVRMKVFAQYYQKHLVPSIPNMPKNWDANTMLAQQKGTYLLTDVCALIPFSAHQIRYQAKSLDKAKEKMGVWKVDGRFVVNLAVFCPWLKKLWKAGSANPSQKRVP